MLLERREWVADMKARFKGKVPADIAKFYERNNVETPLSPEDEAAKAAADEAAAGKKDKKKIKEKKPKGKKKKKTDDSKNIAKIGPTEVVLKFDEFYQTYNQDWHNRDETKNLEQTYDKEMALIAARPEVEKKKMALVDGMLK